MIPPQGLKSFIFTIDFTMNAGFSDNAIIIMQETIRGTQITGSVHRTRLKDQVIGTQTKGF